MTEAEQPKKIWTPDQKVPESVRKMAFLFFLEHLKASFLPHLNNEDFVWEEIYRDCIDMARTVHKVDAENDPKT